ncbi:MAG: NAD-dependent epimerase/dehydratase family protein, partial [Candidatus Nitrosomaritimum aestuariumsis]
GSQEDVDSLICMGAEFLQGDILDYDLLCKFAKDVDCIIHLAAKSDVSESVINPEITNKVNVEGTANVVNCCVQNKIKKIIFASSAAVYGDCNDTITENSKTNPQSPYGQSKLDAEKIIEKTCKENNIDYTIFRIFNVYGKGQNIQYAGVISKFLENISQKKPLVIYGDGEQTRDFISIHDVIKAFDCAVISNNNGTYNIGTGKSLSINDLVKIIFEVFGKKLDVLHKDAKKGDIKDSMVDVSLAKTELGFVAKGSLKKELASIYHE